MADIKCECPEHRVALVPKRTRKYGDRYECPIRGCSVAWWGRHFATPADSETRTARHDFSQAFLSLSEEHAAPVLAWFTENKIEGPGFLTAGEARTAMGIITRIRQEIEAGVLRAQVAQLVTELSSAGQIQFVRRVAEMFPGVNIRSCTDVAVLMQIRGLVNVLHVDERNEAQYRRRAQERAPEKRPGPPPPVEKTKTKRRLDL